MSEPEFHLDAVQRWMQAVIMHPEGVAAGLGSADAREHLDVSPEDVEQVVSRSRALSGVERLEIYAEAYYARLLECLGEEFPILKQTLGDETFDAFAFAYLQRYPSRAYTLGKLGVNFTRFLDETRPNEQDDADVDGSPEAQDTITPALSGSTVTEVQQEREEEVSLPPEWPDFLIDLATLEWTFAQVFDGPGVEGQPLLGVEQLRDIDPEAWAGARLETVPCLKLVALRFPLNEFYSAARRKESPPPPDPAPSWLAVTRRDFVVRRHELTQRQAELLAALQAGETVAAAIERAAQSPGDDLATFANQLRDWFQTWSAEGFFQRVILPSSAAPPA